MPILYIHSVKACLLKLLRVIWNVHCLDGFCLFDFFAVIGREKKMNDTITEMFDRTADEEYESCLPEDSLSACDEKETVHGEEQNKEITVASKKLKSEI